MQKTRLVALGLATAVAIFGASYGCGSSNSGGTADAGGDSGSSVDSTVGGDTSFGGDTGIRPDSGDGAVNITCRGLGAVCAGPADCCSNICSAGTCQVGACTSVGQPCAANGQCCSQQCGGADAGMVCAQLTGPCTGLPLGNACTLNTDCCSGLCFNHLCFASSFCGQTGDVCAFGKDCCSGVCTVPMGATSGTCALPPPGPANCTLVDGLVCGGMVGPSDAGTNEAGLPACGGPCCSRACAPYGPTGVLICQPASGCHPVGDVCTQDSDCCGSAGLPGGSGMPVTCSITPPATLGVCRNPMGCKPNGDVCKLNNTSCNSSCDCCAGNCEQGIPTADGGVEYTCNQDNVGVPRCSFAPSMCAQTGQACASSADCCNGEPCVPNPAFADGGADAGPELICANGCIPKCGLCTTNADCCIGETCIIAQGSASGVCGPCVPDGGIPDAAPYDAPPDAPYDAPPDAAVCGLYGQMCTTNADCCNGVPCSFGNGMCQPGDTGCTCHYLTP